MPPTFILIVLGVAAALLLETDPVESAIGGALDGALDGALSLVAMLSRGPRLTHSPADVNGLVQDDPQDLADESGYELDAYAAGRMISSEEGQSDTTTQAAVVWALINHSQRTGKSILSILTAAKNPRNRGRFGSQKDRDPGSSNFGGSDRYASTALDPYDRDCQIAQKCLDGSIPDFTGGATNYDRPAGEKHPDQIAADRVTSGLVVAEVPGASPGLRFWRPA